MLLLQADHVVSVDQLVDAVWDNEPPSTARSQIQICISALRRTFRLNQLEDFIQTRPPGYLIRADGDQLDLRVFDREARQAKAAAERGYPEEAVTRLRGALDLWTGPALSGVSSQLVQDQAARLNERRLNVYEECVALELRLGRHRELTGELMESAAAHPLRERLRAQLMVALHRSGRQAEALAVYRDTRRELIEQLGIEPGVDLRRLEKEILTDAPTLRLPTSVQERMAPPLQLPPDIGDFTGRTEQVTAMVEYLTADHKSRPSDQPSRLVTVTGGAGAGKSALAIHTAHRLSRISLPEAQLYVDLHGTRGDPLSPSQVLGRFLRALGVPGTAIPDDVDERSALFRSRIAGRRGLIVLDDATDETQIRQLLPGDPDCAVIITSRHRLSGLGGGRVVNVGGFALREAVTFLSRTAGADRVQADAASADWLARCVEGLPLAMRIIGARLADRPHWTLRTMASRLADEHRRLDELAHGGMAVRASMATAYEGLTPPARKLFLSLSALEARAFHQWVAATVMDGDALDTEEALDTLVEAHLLDVVPETRTGTVRYRLHNLARTFAAERFRSLPQEDSAHPGPAVLRCLTSRNHSEAALTT
ncbi:BTAD domain-containing putative transcriptional regulator [Streptomyces sp. NPDC023998]|uniref:AfsR/SARP family transcriptional regulator n=1 Tax=Streptomyces sp. NPDC023998 TaxID=3154597 RepID=UPI0033D9D291